AYDPDDLDEAVETTTPRSQLTRPSWSLRRSPSTRRTSTREISMGRILTYFLAIVIAGFASSVEASPAVSLTGPTDVVISEDGQAHTLSWIFTNNSSEPVNFASVNFPFFGPVSSGDPDDVAGEGKIIHNSDGSTTIVTGLVLVVDDPPPFNAVHISLNF